MFIVLYSGQLSLAAPGFMAIGAYTSVLMDAYWRTPLALHIAAAALSQGINVARYKMIAFVLSAVLAGFAGALEAHLQTFVDPSDQQYGVTRAVQVLTFAVLGGSGHFLGPVVGALVVTSLPWVFD